MMIQLALITGGAVRIGKAIAFCLAKTGYSIAIQYNRSKDEAVDLVAAIAEMGEKLLVLEHLLKNTSKLKHLSRRSTRRWGR